MSYCVILSTASNEQKAKNIAKALLEERLAACINVVPKVLSLYTWKEEIVEDEEVLMVIKTRKDLFESAKDYIIRNHSYDIPEIISLPIEEGYDPYLEWVTKVTEK